MHLFGKIASAFRITFASLRYPDFSSFWFGQAISVTGTWMQRTAQVWLVYTLTRSPFLVGLLGVCQFAPILLLTLFAGVFIDRYPKKRILLYTQTSFMLLSFAMSLLVFLHVVQYWHIFIIASLFGFTQAVDMPARQSFFIELVGPKDIMNAISLNSVMFNLARIVGPAISGIVMVQLGTGFCFLANALSYIAVIFGLLHIRSANRVVKRAHRRVTQEVREGLSYVKHNETLMIDALMMAVLCTFAFNNDVIVPVFAKTVLHRGAAMYTALMSAAGLGSLIGAVVMATLAKYGLRKDLFILDGIVTACIQVGMIFARSEVADLILVAAIGFFNMAFLNLCNSIFQVNTSTEYRGRVMSVYAFLNQGSTPIGNFYAGSVMDHFGGIAGFPACGAAALLLLVPIFFTKHATFGVWLFRNQKKRKQDQISDKTSHIL